jgi:hypothetical protein
MLLFRRSWRGTAVAIAAVATAAVAAAAVALLHVRLPWLLTAAAAAVPEFPISLGGGGSRSTASRTRRCPEHEIPRQHKVPGIRSH